MARLTGYDAISYAETHDMEYALAKHADPTEDARTGLTQREARNIAHEDPSLIYIDVPAEEGDPMYEVAHYLEWTRMPEVVGTARTIEQAREIVAVYVSPFAVTAHDGTREIGEAFAADESGRRDMPLALRAIQERLLTAEQRRIERVDEYAPGTIEAYAAFREVHDLGGYYVIRAGR